VPKPQTPNHLAFFQAWTRVKKDKGKNTRTQKYKITYIIVPTFGK